MRIISVNIAGVFMESRTRSPRVLHFRVHSLLNAVFALYCTFVSHAIYPCLCLHTAPFFYIFEDSPSYVHTHSSFGGAPILWKKHIN